MSHSAIMQAALDRIKHPVYGHDESAKRAVIVKAVQTVMPGKDAPTFDNDRDRAAFLHMRHSLIGNSTLRHDKLDLARDILGGK